VDIQPTDTLYDESSTSDEEFSAEEFYEGLKEAIHDVKEHIAGRKQLSTFDEFVAELRADSA
jgi:hypothetical protein